MSVVRLLADNDLADALVTGLRSRCPTLEFTRLRDLGLDRLSDAEVLAFAAASAYAVVSHDVSTMSTAAIARIQRGTLMTGLFLVHQNALARPALDMLELVCSASEAEDWHDQVVYLPSR